MASLSLYADKDEIADKTFDTLFRDGPLQTEVDVQVEESLRPAVPVKAMSSFHQD
jgi:hypothetical protein